MSTKELTAKQIRWAVKSAASTARLGSMHTADTQATGLDERVLARRHSVLEAAAARLPVHQVMGVAFEASFSLFGLGGA